jgi:hypothetical protein
VAKTHTAAVPPLSSIGASPWVATPAQETIFPDREVVPQQTRPSVVLNQTAGFDHVGPHPQRGLPPISQERSSWHGKAGGKAMTEIVAALLVFLSVSVFLAHAFDAFRTG